MAEGLFMQMCNAQTPDWIWAKSAGGGLGDGTKSIAADEMGNVYAVGNFRSSSITFGTSTFTNAGYYDIFIVKYDADGNVIWAKSAGGTNDDYINVVTLDAAGNVYIGGTSSSPLITFGTTTVNGGGYLVKYNPDGDEQFVKQYIAGVSDVFIDASDKIYVGGSFTASSVIFGTTTLYNAGNGADIYVLKLDANADVIWAKRAGGHYSEVLNSLTVDGSGNIFISGHFQSNPMAIGTFNLYNNWGPYDIFYAKLDVNGNFSWAKSIGGREFEDAVSLVTDPTGNIIMTGHFSDSTITFDSFILTNDTTDNTDDMFVMKFDPAGNSIWAKRFGGNRYDAATSVICDISGNIYVSGYFESPLIMLGSDSITNSGLIVVKYDNDGNYLWTKTSDSSGYHKAFAVAINQDGDLYVGGDFFSFSLHLDSLTLINASTSGGGTIADMFVAKLDSTITVGIEATQTNKSVSIYPNPARNEIIIQNYIPSYIRICNTLGQTVAGTNKTNKLYVGNLPQGLYILQLFDDKGNLVKTEKIIKE